MVLALVIALFPAMPSAEATPSVSGFVEETAISGLSLPAAIRFAPDGRVFVAEKSGRVKVYPSIGSTSFTLLTDLSPATYSYWDRGLLGMALHPNFPAQPYLYLLYTTDILQYNDGCPTPPGPTADGCLANGRLSRIQVSTSSTQVGPEVVMLDGYWCQQYPSHSVGSLQFGPDGSLYVSAGDGASFTFTDYGQRGNPCGDPPVAAGVNQTLPGAQGGALRSQGPRRDGNLVTYDGAILRIDPMTGAAWPGNPLIGGTRPDEGRIIAYGLRNPFRFAVQPGTGDLFIGDVGQGGFEEINRLANPGSAVRNFGWPCYEGTGRQPGYDAANITLCETLYSTPGAVSAPFFSYQHGTAVAGCGGSSSSISGLDFYHGDAFPTKYTGALFFADYSRQCIWAMLTNPNGQPDPGQIELFATAAPAVDLVFGPDGHLYYVDHLGGRVRRIRSTATPPPPPPPPPDEGDGSVRLPGTSGSYISAPDHNRLDITGDIDIRVDVALDDWSTNSGKFISKLGDAYEFMLNGTTRGLRIAWYEQGGGALRIRNSNAVLPAAPGDRLQLRAALDVDNGSGGNTTTFYYRTDTGRALTDNTGWTQLGTPVTASGTSNIRNGSSILVLGSHVNGAVENWAGLLHGALILDGIGAAGTTAANPDFTTTSQLTSTPPNYTTWQDTPGNTWTLNGSASYQQGTTPPPPENQPPVAVIVASPSSGLAPLEVSFDGSGSSDPDGDTLTHEWDLNGNGQFTDATGTTANWTYSGAGVYHVSLRVSDGRGGTHTASTTVTVDSAPPPPPGDEGDGSVRLPGTSGSNISAPDHDRLDITGDIDMRVDVALDDWTTNSAKFISKLGHSYEFMLNGTTRGLRIAWYESTGPLRIRNSTSVLPVQPGERLQLRVTLDVDNGSGGNTTAFYYRTDTGRPLTDDTGWTQLGTPVTASGTSNVRAGSTTMALGSHVNGNQELWAGSFYRALILDGIGTAGTTAANPDFTTTSQLTSAPPNYTTWQDTPGNTWTLNGSATYQQGATPPPPDNQSPTATITSPASTTTWAVGDLVAFSGSGSDPEDGVLPPSAMSWSLVIHHCATQTDCHQHPVQTFSGVSSGSFVAPDHEYPSFLELALTVTDQDGATHTSSVTLQPRTVALTFQTDPAGLTLTVGSTSQTAPFSRIVIVGSSNSIAAPSPQTLAGATYLFSSWSHGGPAAQEVIAPTTATIFTATYSSEQQPPPPSEGVGSVRLPGTSGSYVSAPDHNRLDVTGDIDLRVDVGLDDWTTNSGKFISKLGDAYEFMLDGTSSRLSFRWYPTRGGVNTRNSTVALPVQNGDRLQLRVTLDVDNGAKGHVVTFYYRSDTSQPLTSQTGWTQLGSQVVGKQATSVRSGASSLMLGAGVDGANSWAGRFYRALIIDGIGAAGTIAANPDFTTTGQLTSIPPSYTTWQDIPGNTWTLNGSATYLPVD